MGSDNKDENCEWGGEASSAGLTFSRESAIEEAKLTGIILR